MGLLYHLRAKQSEPKINVHITLEEYFRELFSRPEVSEFEKMIIDQLDSVRNMAGYHVMNSSGVLVPGQIPDRPSVDLTYTSHMYPISNDIDRFGLVAARPVLEGAGLYLLLDSKRIVTTSMRSAFPLIQKAMDKKYSRSVA